MRIFTTLVVVALASACTDGERSDRTERRDPAGADAGATPLERIYDYGLSFGESVSKIEATLGPPPSADTTLEPNRHVRDATDSLFVLRYDGLTFALNRPGPVDRELLTSVELTDVDRELPDAVRIRSTTRDDLTSRMGAPGSIRSHRDTTILSYAPPVRAADRFVEFHLLADTLRLVRWVPYVD